MKANNIKRDFKINPLGSISKWPFVFLDERGKWCKILKRTYLLMNAFPNRVQKTLFNFFYKITFLVDHSFRVPLYQHEK